MAISIEKYAMNTDMRGEPLTWFNDCHDTLAGVESEENEDFSHL
jgi:hypothetical protein